MRALHKAAIEFIEQISLQAESAGFSRISGRIIGLLVIEQKPLSFDDLASDLQISRGSVSANTQLLEARRVIRRVSRIGKRKDFFELDPDFPERFLERHLTDQRALRQIAVDTRHKLPDRYKNSKEALHRVEQFCAMAVTATENMLEEWRYLDRKSKNAESVDSAREPHE